MMKKYLLFIPLIVFFFIACSSPDKDAQNLITQGLKETLHDWNSYESVKFGTLDSTFTTVFDDSIYINCFAKFTVYSEQMENGFSEVDKYGGLTSDWAISKMESGLEKAKFYADSVKYYKSKADAVESDFTPEFNGWQMQHSFRANNAGGNKTIGHFIYYFDNDITKITSSKDITESSKD